MRRQVLFAVLAMGCAGQVDPGPVGDDDDDDDDSTPTGDTGTPVEPPPGDVRVVLNELMADNESTVNGPDGPTFPDWVEIVNLGEEPVVYSRLGLRNADGATWEGGDGELPAGGRTVLWADETLELGFGLDKENDEITLLVDGRPVDTVDIDDLGGDVAFARTPDGTGSFLQTAWATPGYPNELEASPTLQLADETVFHDRFVHQIEFNVTSEVYNRLNQGGRPEVHAGLTIDGVTYEDIGLKLKGSASYDTMDGKPAFLVDLNEWVAGTKHRGLKAFKLHNGNVFDPTRTHDYLTYQLARDAGLMGPRVGWAEVYVNAEYYGIYMVIEKHDDEMIAYHYPDQEDIGVILEPNEGFYDFGNNLSEESILLSWEEGPTPPDPLVIDALQATSDLIGRQPTDAAWGGAAWGWCMGNDGCRHDYAEHLLTMADRVETLDLATQFQDLSLWLDPLIQADPRYNPWWGSVAESRQSTVERLAENPTRARNQVYAEFPDLQL